MCKKFKFDHDVKNSKKVYNNNNNNNHFCKFFAPVLTGVFSYFLLINFFCRGNIKFYILQDNNCFHLYILNLIIFKKNCWIYIVNETLIQRKMCRYNTLIIGRTHRYYIMQKYWFIPNYFCTKGWKTFLEIEIANYMFVDLIIFLFVFLSDIKFYSLWNNNSFNLHIFYVLNLK